MPSPLVEQKSEASPVQETTAKLPPEDPVDGLAKDGRRSLVRWSLLLATVAAVALAAVLLVWLGRMRHAAGMSNATTAALPAAPHETLRLKGTTQAVETRAILAPLLAGEQSGTLTILSLRPAGSKVKQGDLLVEFDRQAQLRDFIDKQAQSDKIAGDVLQEQAKEDAAKAKDEAEIQTAKDSFDRAGLEIEKTELMSKIDAEKAREEVDETKATLGQLKETFELKRKAAQASIRILTIQRDRARETMLHSQANATLMQVRSPINGIVVLNTIWKEGSMGEVQEGDQVRPGVPFMQVVDPSAMEVEVSVNQQDVLALRDGQRAKIYLEAYPDLVCPGELKVMDPMGKPGAFSAKVRVFSALFSADCTDPRLLPGLTAAVDLLPLSGSGVSETAR